MPDEDDLRRLLQLTHAPNSLDAKRVVSRSRSRRLPKQLAAGALGAFVLAGVTVLAVQTQYTAPATMSAGETADQSAPASPEMSTLKRAPADRINFCAGALADLAGSQYGLQLDVLSPANAPAGAGGVPVTVRLTNTSSARVTGFTPSSPAITLSQNGIVLWHSNGPTDLSLVAVDLGPGESLDYSATFEPVRCEVADDEAESFRPDLPVVEPGEYGLSALIDFTADASMAQLTTELDLVSGPVALLTLG